MPRFTGFPPEAFTVLADLKENDRRSRFGANRDRYEASWMGPRRSTSSRRSGRGWRR